MIPKKYNVIYADPPWSYDNKSMKFTQDGENLAVEQQYSLMTNSEIKRMPIREICDDNAICFMWCVNPLMPIAFDVLKHWGFEYKTMLTWKKTSGTGFWFRGVTEHILMGIRGDVKCFRSGIDNFHECKSGKHSQKPHYFRDLVDRMTRTTFEEQKKLEIFARTRDNLFGNHEYDGWDVFGNQVDNSIVLPNWDNVEFTL